MITEKNINKAILADSEILTALAGHLSVTVEALKGYMESKMSNTCEMFIDGGARGNPGEAGIGVVLKVGNDVRGYYYYIGHATNNIAEYKALITGLQIAYKRNIKKIKCYSDSELLCRQINGAYKVKSENLKLLFQEAIANISRLDAFQISHVRREKNKEADSLANKAMDTKSNGEVKLTVAPLLNHGNDAH